MSVRRLRLADAPRAADTLARAFRDNPGTLALLPRHDERGRLVVLRRVALGFTVATIVGGHAEADFEGDVPRAVSLSFDPSSYPFSAAVRGLVSAGPLSAGLGPALRYARIGAYLERHHSRAPSWYLFMLGVAPELQGRGLGGRLLRDLAARADAQGVACYLETDRASSVRLYERHGFDVTRHDRLAMLSDLEFWTMTRPAKQE